jgi:hypothetical protein
MQVSQAKKLKDLERENVRLKSWLPSRHWTRRFSRKPRRENTKPRTTSPGGSPRAADADCLGAAGLPGAGSATIDAAPHARSAR